MLFRSPAARRSRRAGFPLRRRPVPSRRPSPASSEPGHAAVTADGVLRRRPSLTLSGARGFAFASDDAAMHGLPDNANLDYAELDFAEGLEQHLGATLVNPLFAESEGGMGPADGSDVV